MIDWQFLKALVAAMAIAMMAAAVLCLLDGCKDGYTNDDKSANTIGARSESRVLDFCATDDASTCTPSKVRAFTLLSYCANARELAAHGAPVPEAGVACQPR